MIEKNTLEPLLKGMMLMNNSDESSIMVTHKGFVFCSLQILMLALAADADQICASCNAVSDQSTCQHHITCGGYESCYVQNYETEPGMNLYNMGCMTDSECPHYATAIIGRRAEGDHVMCTACCNNASLCNKELSCEAGRNQDVIYPRDCSEIRVRERANDTYIIYPHGVKHRPVSVFCVFDYTDVAWTVFQRRKDGSVDFYRDWRDYVAGFGSTNDEYWLGLENIYAVTSIPNYELKVVMEDFERVTKHASFTSFHIGDASTNYRLTVYGYSGTAGNSMKRQDGMMFSTYDQDHDTKTSENCAAHFHGAWWYNECHDSNLNGKYLSGTHTTFADGINWRSWHGYYYSLKSVIMMIHKT